MIINGLRIAAIISAALVSSISLSAEQLYTDQPPVTPELAFPGDYDVGVTSITATDPKRLNTSNFITSIERPLVLEVWYPAQAPEEVAQATYKNVTRLQKPFELQGDAYRDAQDAKHGQSSQRGSDQPSARGPHPQRTAA